MSETLVRLARPARVAAFTALLAVGARLSVPFWPVNLTLQTLVLAVGGLALGPWVGLAGAGLYLLLGLAGLPVFTAGGGPGYVFLPGFGFLLGFLPGVVVTGIARGLDRRFPRTAAYITAAFLGLLPIYLVGIPYYSLIKGLYGHAPAWAILGPFLVYIPGDIAKAVVAGVIYQRLSPVIGNVFNPV